MAQESLRGLGHDSASECIALVGAEVMAFLPAAADELLKIGTGIEVFVLG